jgi:2-keto-4-pentenoate hydratase/2-oxohepta-3-ene-1,7-dioic acid hydratase in catechol pathway
MRLARIRTPSHEIRYARVEDQALRLIDGDIFGSWSEHEETIAPNDCELLAPVVPPQIFAIGLNYRDHAAESGSPVPEEPLIFAKTLNAVTHPGSPIVIPREAPDEVDYEAELVVVIGRRTRSIPEHEALSAVLGYCCGNDVSARDCQRRRDRQWTRAKSFDTFCPLGPWIETELDPGNLAVHLDLNGERMQDGNTANMVFNVPRLISYLSACFTLLPGSVILTGTPPGVGFGRTPPVFLKPGDVVSVSIEGIGTLTNPVRASGEQPELAV